MKLDLTHLPLAFLLGFFLLVVPFIVRLAAGIVRVEEVTRWRCVKAAMAGLAALFLGVRIGGEMHSLMLGILVMAVTWAASIHFFFKTNLPRALGIWFVTHGCVFVIGFVVNQFVDVEAQVIQLLAAK